MADVTSQAMSPWHVDWHRLARRAVIVCLGLFAVGSLYFRSRGAQYGMDFRGGTWHAAHAMLAGQSPFPPANPMRLLRLATGFITPPLLAIIGIPFSFSPFWLAIALWNLACVGALIGALHLVGVRGQSHLRRCA